MKTALYPGSFDPITNGHLDIIKRALRLFDVVHIGVGINSGKRPLFSVDDRVAMVKQTCQEHMLPEDRVQVSSFGRLVTTHAQYVGAVAIIRGLRTITDFEYEFQFAHVTRKLAPNLEVVLLPTTEENSYVSSSLVRELHRYGGDITPFVPLCVVQQFAALHLRQTWNMVP